MDVVVYGVDEAPPGFRVAKNVEELHRHLRRAFIVVVGDKRLAEELGAAYFFRGDSSLEVGRRRRRGRRATETSGTSEPTPTFWRLGVRSLETPLPISSRQPS